MKKLILVLAISLVLLMPVTCASWTAAPKHLNRSHRLSTDGNFSATFFLKNDTGYIPLGDLSGTYSNTGMSTTFVGVWSLDDGTASGTFNGWMWSHLFFGQLNTTGGNQSNWFIGLAHVNETDNSFAAVSIVFSEEQYLIRYILGDM